MSTREVELKLLVDPAALPRLRRLPLIRSLRQGRAASRQLRSTYFDTPDLDLWRAGMGLRVRRVAGRNVQTLKTVGKASAGLFDRGEWEAEVEGERPDLDRLADTPLAGLATPDLATSLRPVFTTTVRRSIHHLAADGWEIELAFDNGEITAGDGAEPISEVELELRQGEPRDVFRLARLLHEAVPMRLGRASKAERGYRLATGGGLRPVKWRGPSLRPDMSAAAALQTILRGGVDHLLANHECLLATGDPEAVHQMRVALRRLRSAIGLFGEMLGTPETEAVRADLRWLLGRLGPARDADVFIAEILDRLPDHLAEDSAVAQLRARFVAEREDHYRAALEALASPRFTRLLLDVGAWMEGGDWLAAEHRRQAALDRPIAPLAARLLDRRWRKLRKAGRKLAGLSAEERHRLRIRIKKMRYAAESFASLYPEKRVRRLVASLSTLQDLLGALNDIAVADRLLAERRGADGPHAWAAGLLTGWHAARADRLLADALAEWKAFAKVDAYWRK